MAPGGADDEHRVSYHAVTRYVQRILKVEITTTPETSKEQAVAHAAAAGMSVPEIRAIIWSKGISAAVAMGLPQCATRHFSVVIAQPEGVIAQPEGVIATILAPRPRDTSRLKLMSEKELKSKAWRISRRRSASRDTQSSMEGEQA